MASLHSEATTPETYGRYTAIKSRWGSSAGLTLGILASIALDATEHLGVPAHIARSLAIGLGVGHSHIDRGPPRAHAFPRPPDRGDLFARRALSAHSNDTKGCVDPAALLAGSPAHAGTVEARPLRPRVGFRAGLLDASGRSDGDHAPRRLGRDGHASQRRRRGRRDYRREVVGTTQRPLRRQRVDVDRVRWSRPRSAVVARGAVRSSRVSVHGLLALRHLQQRLEHHREHDARAHRRRGSERIEPSSSTASPSASPPASRRC